MWSFTGLVGLKPRDSRSEAWPRSRLTFAGRPVTPPAPFVRRWCRMFINELYSIGTFLGPFSVSSAASRQEQEAPRARASVPRVYKLAAATRRPRCPVGAGRRGPCAHTSPPPPPPPAAAPDGTRGPPSAACARSRDGVSSSDHDTLLPRAGTYSDPRSFTGKPLCRSRPCSVGRHPPTSERPRESSGGVVTRRPYCWDTPQMRGTREDALGDTPQTQDMPQTGDTREDALGEDAMRQRRDV